MLTRSARYKIYSKIKNLATKLILLTILDYTTATNPRAMIFQPNQQDVKIVMPRHVMENPPKTYMGYSVFNTVCCCLCIGIAAIIFSAKTKEANKRGDYQEAEKYSKKAKRLNKTAFLTGLVILIFYILLNYYNKSRDH